MQLLPEVGRMRHPGFIRMLLLAGVILFGGVAPRAQAHEPEQIDGGLVRVGDKAAIAYANPDVDFTRYNKVLLDPLDLSQMEIVPPRGTGKSAAKGYKFTERDAELYRKYFRGAMLKEMTRSDYEVVDVPGDGVLRARLDIIHG